MHLLINGRKAREYKKKQEITLKMFLYHTGLKDFFFFLKGMERHMHNCRQRRRREWFEWSSREVQKGMINGARLLKRWEEINQEDERWDSLKKNTWHFIWERVRERGMKIQKYFERKKGIYRMSCQMALI